MTWPQTQLTILQSKTYHHPFKEKLCCILIIFDYSSEPLAFCCAKKNLMQKCIFAYIFAVQKCSAYILCTFCSTKCSARHHLLQNKMFSKTSRVCTAPSTSILLAKHSAYTLFFISEKRAYFLK